MTTAAAEELTKQITIKNTLAPAGHYLTRPVRLLREYDRVHLRPDLMAGITVAVILLPQAIAFALIADLPPEMGLYAAVIGGIGRRVVGLIKPTAYRAHQRHLLAGLFVAGQRGRRWVP